MEQLIVDPFYRLLGNWWRQVEKRGNYQRNLSERVALSLTSTQQFAAFSARCVSHISISSVSYDWRCYEPVFIAHWSQAVPDSAAHPGWLISARCVSSRGGGGVNTSIAIDWSIRRFVWVNITEKSQRERERERLAKGPSHNPSTCDVSSKCG